MANAQTQIEKLTKETADFAYDGVIVEVFPESVTVRPVGQGRSRVKRGVGIPDNISKDTLRPGIACRMGIHQGKPILLAVFPDQKLIDYAGRGSIFPSQPIVTSVQFVPPANVVVRWMAVEGATKYIIYKNDKDNPVTPIQVGEVPSGTLEVSVPHDSTYHWYAVQAVSGLNKSQLSAWRTDTSTPPPPDTFTPQGNQDSILLTIGNNDPGLTSPLTAYIEVQQADDVNGTNAQTVGQFTSAQFPHRIPIAPGTTKYYRARATSHFGYSSQWTSWAGATSFHATIQDRFSTYGGDTTSDVNGLYWLQLTTMEESQWTGGSLNTSMALFGDTCLEMSLSDTTSTVATYTPDTPLNLSVDKRFQANDYITMLLYASANVGLGHTIDIRFHTTQSDYYTATISISWTGWSLARVKKSQTVAQGMPDWSNITQISFISGPVQTTPAYIYIDNLQINKSDPDDSSVHNPTGKHWNFVGDAWFITRYKGNSAHEPGGSQNSPVYALSSMNVGAQGYYLAYKPLGSVNITDGVLACNLFARSQTNAGIAFFIQQVPQYTMYTVTINSAGPSVSNIEFAKWENGVKTVLQQKAFANWIVLETPLSLGVDLKEYQSDNGKIKVFLNFGLDTNPMDGYHWFTAYDTSLPVGGSVGLYTSEGNVRFMRFRAGSPQHADVADVAYALDGAILSGDRKIVYSRQNNRFEYTDDGTSFTPVSQPATGGDVDTLNGQPGSYYLNRLNHTGTQNPSTISPQGVGSGLDADLLDGSHASDFVLSSTFSAHVADPSAHHAPVSLSTDADALLGLTGQELTLDAQSANTVLAGPASGAATAPTFRALVDADIPATIVRTSRQIIAGAGLTGGGALSSDVTLDVGAGAGITVNANDVSLTTPGTLSVSSTNNASGNHTHAITASSNPGAAESLLKSDTSGGLTLQSLMLGGPLQDVTNPTLSYLDLDIDGLGTPYDSHVALVAANTFSIAIDSNRNTSNRDFLIGKDAPLPTDAYWVSLFGVNESGDVTIYTGDLVFNTGATIQTTTGDLTLDPAGDDVLPRSSVAVDIGDYNRKWRTLFASELYVETLVAQDVLATIGGRVMVAPTTKLIADVNTTQTTIDVEHNNLVSGGYIYLASAPGGVAQVEVMKVTSGATTISGGYRYSVSRNKDGTGANSWVKGDAVVYLGKNAGEGYIDLTSTQTIHNHLGPTMTIYSRTGSGTWNAVNPVVAVGNLSSFLDYGGDEFGFAVGDDLTLGVSSFSGLAADRTNGLRLFNTDIALYNSGTQTVSIANDGNTWFGADSANKTLQITTTGANAGDVEVGGYSNSGVGMLWDESAGELKIGGSVLVGAGLGPTISDVVAYLPFTRPLGTGDFQVNLQTHLGRSPTTVTGTPIGRPGKFRNGVEVRSVATNEVKNPVFENDVTTGWWFSSSGSTATRTRDTVRKYIGSASCKIDCVSDTYAYQRIDYNISVANGETVWAQARVWRDSSSVSSYVRIRDQTNSVDRATTYSSTTGEWELLFASWTNNTGSSVNVRLQVGVASSGPGVAWFDACQLEASAYPNAFTYGDMPNSSWSGTAHNSTSTSVASGFNFNNDADLLASISPDEGTLAFWFTPQAPLDGTYSGIGWGDYVVVAWNGEDNNSVGVRNNDATGKLQIRIRYNAISYTSGTTLNAGETTHFAFTWSVKDGYIRAYKNGVQVVSASGFTGFPAACDKFAFETCKVGAVISDVFVLSRALTANEVEAIASSNLPVTVSRNNHELLLTGAGAGKVWGYSGGLFGQGADGSPSFALVNEDGVSWDGGTLDSGDLQLGYGTAKLLYDASANVLQIGDISGGDYIALGGGAGITLYSNSKDVVYLSTSGSVRFGTTGANTANLTWNGSDLNLRLNTTSNFRLEGATGSLLMGNGVGSDANIRFAVIGSGGRTVNGESLSSGDVLLGSNVGSKANVLWDESAGQLLFRGGTTTQAYVDTDGKIVAGAGNVWLDTGGVSIYYGAKGIFPPGTSGLKALSDVDSSLQGGLFYWYPSGYPTAYYVSLSCGGYPDVSGVPEFRLGSYNAQKEAYLYNVTHLTVTDGAVNRLGWIMLRRSSETGPYNGAGTTIEFNDTIKKDTTWYAHSTTTNPGDITILSAGWYRVSFTILIKNNLADRSCIYVQLYKNGSLVNGSRAETYIRHQSYGRMGHCSSSFLVYCNQNDVLNLKTGGQAGSSAFYGGGCSYYIEAQSQITIERVGV